MEKKPAFYWRLLAGKDYELRVCRECERITEDPAASCNFTNVRIRGVRYSLCTRCGTKERDTDE